MNTKKRPKQHAFQAIPPGALLKPIQIKRAARVPYLTVISWLTVGHPQAGILPSIDLAPSGKRHSYRVRLEDWQAFLAKLQTAPRGESDQGERG